MAEITAFKDYFISSSRRSDGTDSNFTFPLNVTADSNFTHVVVTQCSIPKTFYLVEEGKNTFTLKIGASEWLITVPPGNYSRKSFQYKVSLLLATASGNNTFAVTYDPTNIEPETGKYIIKVQGAATNPQMIFDDTPLAAVLGMNANAVHIFNNMGGSDYALTSVKVCNFITEPTLFLHSDLVQADQHDNGDVLQEVFCSIGEDFYSNIPYQAQNWKLSAKKIRAGSVGSARFWLKNEDGYDMNLNGINMVFTLRFLQVVDPMRDLVAVMQTGFELLSLKLDRLTNAVTASRSQVGGGRDYLDKKSFDRWMEGYHAGLEYAKTASDDDISSSDITSDEDPEDEYFRGMSTAST